MTIEQEIIEALEGAAYLGSIDIPDAIGIVKAAFAKDRQPLGTNKITEWERQYHGMWGGHD